MAKTLLYESPNQTFSLLDFYNLYGITLDPSPFSLVVGETYTIVWDDVSYTCVARDGSVLIDGVVYMGNASNFGIPSDDVPFGFVYWSNGAGIDIVSAEDTKAEDHAFGVYQGEEENEENTHESPDIVLKNRDGSDVAYPNVRVLRVRTTDGGIQTYTAGEALENIPIELDFSDGDQTIIAPDGTFVLSAVIEKPDTLKPENIVKDVNVAGVVGTTLIPQGEELVVAPDFSDGNVVVTPNDGYMFSEVTVEKPSALIPENIAEGVDVAGIIGTLAAGGGGGGGAFSSGTFTGDPGTNGAITHGLGVVPDVISICSETTLNISSGNPLQHYVILSSALKEKLGTSISTYGAYSVGSNSKEIRQTGVIGTGSFDAIVADDNTFKLAAGLTYRPRSGTKYTWFAIGGLA